MHSSEYLKNVCLLLTPDNKKDTKCRPLNNFSSTPKYQSRELIEFPTLVKKEIHAFILPIGAHLHGTDKQLIISTNPQNENLGYSFLSPINTQNHCLYQNKIKNTAS